MAIGTMGALALGGVASTLVGAKSADKQADAVSDASSEQIALQRDIYRDQKKSLAEQKKLATPFYNRGLSAFKRYSRLTDQPFKETQAYKFQKREGLDALDAQARAGGMALSGAALKSAQQYGTGLASQEYGNYMNRLAALGGVGQTATNQIGNANSQIANAGSNFAAGATNALGAMGQAQAAGYANSNQAIQSGFGEFANTLGMAYGGYFGDEPGFGITPFTNPYA